MQASSRLDFLTLTYFNMWIAHIQGSQGGNLKKLLEEAMNQVWVRALLRRLSTNLLAAGSMCINGVCLPPKNPYFGVFPWDGRESLKTR